MTIFFRDAEDFAALKQKIVPQLLQRYQCGASLRLWAPGCATGEDVYSLAMALLEAIGPAPGKLAIRIFGTDISGEAIATARSGLYLKGLVRGVSLAQGRLPRGVLTEELRGMHVLMVDDDQNTRDATGEMLSAHGARITSAASVAEAMIALHGCDAWRGWPCRLPPRRRR